MSVARCVALRPKAGQTVVGDLQDEAVIHDAVGGLEFTVGEDDAVVEEEHALQTQRRTAQVTPPAGNLLLLPSSNHTPGTPKLSNFDSSVLVNLLVPHASTP